VGGLVGLGVGEKPVAPFILGLIAGIFILLGAILMSMFTFGAVSMTGSMSGMAGMMSGMYGGMNMGMMMSFASTLVIVGLASGTMVVLGALMLYRRPAESRLWGAIILAFSLASILGSMGGLLVGLILGMLGGILALTWSETPKIVSHTSVALSARD